MAVKYVEIDVHKHSFQAAIVDEEECFLEESRLRNNREGIMELINRLDATANSGQLWSLQPTTGPSYSTC